MTEEIFDKLVEVVRASKVPCRLKLTNFGASVECGRDYPNRVFHKISSAAEKINLTDRDFDICAETSGGILIKSISVNGGPKRY